MNTKIQQLDKGYVRIGALMLFTVSLLTVIDSAYALTAGDMALQVTSNFEQIGKMITAAAYICGMGFAIGAILKFKQHKDNPTQIPVGTPIALLFVAAALVFLPTIFDITGSTLFGAGGGTAGGPLGTLVGGV